MKTILSYGAGVNSTALLVLRENEIEEAVFANHGGDYPETYEYVKYMEKQGFPITVITPDVEGFDNLYNFCFKKRIIPSRMYRWCTDKFKIKPITKYLDKPCMLYIGFCADEAKRVKSEFKFKKGIAGRYPLIKENITREGCIQIIKDAGLKVPRKSCCFFCPFMRRLEARELFLEYPQLYIKCKELEENCMRRDIFISEKPIDKRAMEKIPPLSTWLGAKTK